MTGQIDERPMEPQSHEYSNSSHTNPELPSLEQSNEGLRTSVGTGIFNFMLTKQVYMVIHSLIFFTRF